MSSQTLRVLLATTKAAVRVADIVDGCRCGHLPGLNYLDKATVYEQVIVVTDGGNNCETNLEARENVKRVIFLTPNDPAVFPRSTVEQIQERLTAKVVVKKLQD